MNGWHQLFRRLRSAVLIEGRPDQALKLSARMEHYRVPGVGLAVARGGELKQAVGYGVSGESRP
jgi:hypothetical protein